VSKFHYAEIGKARQDNPLPLAFPKSDIAEDTRDDDDVLQLVNKSAAMVPMGSVVAFDTAGTVEMAFVTVIVQTAAYIYGVTQEDIGVDAAGKVQMVGIVDTRTAVGTGLYRWVEPSSTAGVAQGTTVPTDASFGRTLAARNTTTGRQLVLLSNATTAVTINNTVIHKGGSIHNQISPPATPDAGTLNIYMDSGDGKLRVMKVGGVSVSLEDEYGDIVAPGAAQRTNWWDDFHGHGDTPVVNVFERYELGGSSAPTFQNDTTTGRAYVLTAATTALNSASYLFLRGQNGVYQARANELWWMKFMVLQQQAPIGGTQDFFLGLFETVPAGDQPDGIYFRAVDTGNWFLVCRDAGSETTLDMGVAPSSTLILLEFRIESTTSVAGYYNNTKIGSSITATIPTNLLYGPFVGHHVRAITATTSGRISCFGWGMEGAMQ